MANTLRQSKRSVNVPLIVLSLLFVGATAFGGIYYSKYQDLKTETAKTADERNKELVAKINAVYELPKDETPVVAIVSEEETFKKEYPVFTTAKKGDVLLLYEKAGQAVLYRESENKVIGTATFAVKKAAVVQIIASTDLQAATEKTLTEKLPNDVRVGGKSTPKNSYTSTTVIDLTGQKADLAKSIATAVGGTVVAALPSEEVATEGAEIVVIVASQQVAETTQ